MANRLVDAGLILILLLAPTQYAFEVRGIHFSPVDPLIGLIFLLWLVAEWRRGGPDCLRLPPAMMLLFPVLAGLSVVTATNRMETCRELLQLAEYFWVAALLLVHWIRDPASLRRALYMALTAASLLIGLALIQYFTPGLQDFHVQAAFGNRNVLGGYLALLLPLALGLLLWDRTLFLRLWMGGLLAGGLLVCLSGGTWIALLAALALVAAWRSLRALVVVLLVMAVLTALVLPRHNLDVLKESVDLFDAEGEIRPRCTEWQAALNMWSEHPLLGVGLGNYQANIGQHYGYVPRANRNVTEPDSHNLYLVLLGSSGLLGLAGFLGLLISGVRNALCGFSHRRDPWEQGVAAGLAGSLLAFALNSVWAGLLVRGLGLPLVLALVAAAVLARPEGEDADGGNTTAPSASP